MMVPKYVGRWLQHVKQWMMTVTPTPGDVAGFMTSTVDVVKVVVSCQRIIVGGDHISGINEQV